MSFPRYPKYKDSGVEWLGEVPEHWKTIRLAAAAELLAGYSFDASLFGFDGVPAIRMSDFGDGRVHLEDAKRVEPALVPEKSMARSGDILLGLSGSISNFAIVTESDLPIAVNQRVAIVRVRGVQHGLVKWFLQSKEFSDQIVIELPETTIQNISMGQLRRCKLPSPPREEQQMISQFLDRETAKIDELVAEQQRLIELLKEKRQAVISHTVTKGLNPHAPMKSSGIEWLGDVPAHWEVRSISSISTKITNGYVGPTRDILRDDGVRYLQSLHIKENQIRFNAPYFVDEEWSKQHSKSILEAGDVLIVQTGDIGQVAVVTEEFVGCNCHALIIVAPLRAAVDGEWISWALNSDYGLQSLLSIQTGALHPHLNCGEVKSAYLPLPPISEQREIVAYVTGQLGEFDALIYEAQRAIDLLQERHTALISAAVTGQIDVRQLGERRSAA
jgi:type I restriction enzyme S subunit